MYKLYTWCTTLGKKLEDGDGTLAYQKFYEDYFTKTNVCSTIFFLGIAIATVIAILYYFGICNHVFKLAKRWSWLGTLAVVFGVTLSITIPTIVGQYNEEEPTGIFFSIRETLRGLNKPPEGGGSIGPVAEKENIDVAKEFRSQFLPKGETHVTPDTLPREMALANGCYAMIVFIGLSFAFKRHTKHGSSIPL